jgi:glutamate formiminotransferase/glutamate formiminotransferase/formiminotetrahydrofolate cyclodeaminase
MPTLLCAMNLSEGRRPALVEAIAAAGGPAVLDVHTDPDHNRAVVTMAGEDAARAVAAAAVERLDLHGHEGVHPRIGVVDVVPFAPRVAGPLEDAVAARDRFAHWAAAGLGLPCFLYGPERSLPDVRRGAFTTLTPDVGPAGPHPTAGACAVGARGPLVAYNLWLAAADLVAARAIAASLRGPAVRALGLPVGGAAQVSCNLVDPDAVGPAAVYDAVAAQTPVARAELVGLLPAAVLAAIPPARWAELDLGEDRTVESRLEARGLAR